MKIRIKFSKYGSLRFIGHLDVMRFFQKAIRRAGIDVAYTTGFSPHQIMTFASPLGMGMCSLGEYMDIEVHSHQGAQDMKERLQAQCPFGIDILSVKALPEPEPNKKVVSAMASVSAASYAAVWKEKGRSFCDYGGQCADFLAQEEILVEKEEKKGTVFRNIRLGIYELKIEDDALLFTVDASSSGNIRPSWVASRFLDFIHVAAPDSALQIIRLELYTHQGDGPERTLVPLDAIGEEF